MKKSLSRKSSSSSLRFTKRRSEILDSTIEFILLSGVDELTMDSIARQSDVSKPTLYSYFPNKEALLREALDAISQKSIVILEDAGLTVYQKLEKLFSLQPSQQSDKEGAVYPYGWFPVYFGPEFENPANRFLLAFCAMLQRAKESGEVSSEIPEMTLAALIFRLLVIKPLRSSIARIEADTEEMLQLFRLMLRT